MIFWGGGGELGAMGAEGCFRGGVGCLKLVCDPGYSGSRGGEIE